MNRKKCDRCEKLYQFTTRHKVNHITLSYYNEKGEETSIYTQQNLCPRCSIHAMRLYHSDEYQMSI